MYVLCIQQPFVGPYKHWLENVPLKYVEKGALQNFLLTFIGEQSLAPPNKKSSNLRCAFKCLLLSRLINISAYSKTRILRVIQPHYLQNRCKCQI